mmetsp:Transcript_14692/g.19272  ORF Transcript_14692/g.19272 Transcript_14692/m.19272 type:complete len:614 (+) Transcript_14692:67-1908(+)
MSSYPLIPVEEAFQIVTEAASRNSQGREVEEVSLSCCSGRILGENVVAEFPIPVLPTSIKDGYAIKSSATLPGKFKVVGASRAGHFSELENHCCSETAVYVTTGGALPPGYDAVVEIEKIEKVKSEDLLSENLEEIFIPSTTIQKYADVRTVGSDIQLGESVLLKGERISSASVGMLAMLGRKTVKVLKQVKVGILSTGDELVDCSEEGGKAKLMEGHIFDANRPMLIAACKEEGAEVIDLGISKDYDTEDTNGMDKWLRSLLDADADLIVTSGGVSMGDKDFIKFAISRAGDVHFGRMKMKPGKPTTFATIPRKGKTDLIFFSLPGNPVSSIVTFNLLVIPTLRTLMATSKDQSVALTRIHCKLSQRIKLDPFRPEYHRALLSYSDDSGFLATSTGFQRSSRLTSMKNADVLLELPSSADAGVESVDAGTLVSGLLLSDLRNVSHRIQGQKLEANHKHNLAHAKDYEKACLLVCCSQPQEIKHLRQACNILDLPLASVSHTFSSVDLLKKETILLLEKKKIVILASSDPSLDSILHNLVTDICSDRLIPGVAESLRQSCVLPSITTNPLLDSGMSEECVGQYHDSIVFSLCSLTRLRERILWILNQNLIQRI